MEISQLRIIREIHRAGSLSKASMHLDKAQSIVSRHLAAFEKQCGGRIFHRNGRGVELTEFGSMILPQIELVIETMERMIGSGRAAANELAGSVRLTITPTMCAQLAPALFDAIRRDHPLIRLQIVETYSSDSDHALDSGGTDIAVLLSNGTSVSANQEAICQFDTYLVGLPGAAMTRRQEILFSELEGLPLLMPTEPSYARGAISFLAAERGIPLDIVAEVDSPSGIRALFDAGAGYLIAAVGCGPAAGAGLIGRQIAAGLVHGARIRDPDLKRTLVVGTAASVPARVDVVRKTAIRILRELVAQDAEPVRTFGT